MNTMTPPAPAAAPDVAPAPAAAQPPAPKKGGRKKLWIAGAALLLGIGMAIGAASGSQEGDPAPVGAAPAAPAEVPAPATVPEPTTAPEPPVVEEVPAETVGQENARQSAEDYLAYSAFSRQGLIAQLEYEGYSTKDATYGVNQTGL
jgi:Host cell surface-exposed lipoprotein